MEFIKNILILPLFVGLILGWYFTDFGFDKESEIIEKVKKEAYERKIDFKGTPFEQEFKGYLARLIREGK